MNRKSLIVASIFALGAVLAACSGGTDVPTPGPVANNASPPPPPPAPPPPPPPSSSAPTFTPGVFADANTFVDRCEVVRTGVDIEGNPFPDMPGSGLIERFWLRSWTNETYLFNTEVADRDPNDFNDRLSYFDVMRTFAVTPSGEDKDDFHFSQPTTDFLARRNSTARAGYGISFAVFSNTVPRDYRVRYTEPNSPASSIILGEPALKRGTRILEIDGVSLVNGSSQSDIDTLNAGLFPATPGERHTFVVQDAGSSTTRTFTITSGNVSQQPVNRTGAINTPTGDVGYILFNTFSPFASEADIADAFTQMSNAGVSDLVLDLRYNGGGLLAVSSQLAYMIAGRNRTQGRTYSLLEFNGGTNIRNPVTGQVNEPIPFYDQGLGFSLPNGAPLDSLDLDRVYILSTEGTCSASEAVINGLRGVNVEVIVIGDITCGKPFGFYPTDNCGETYFTIQFQSNNDMGFGAYTDGFVPNTSTFPFGVRVPGCIVPDTLGPAELGDENEGLLAAALQFRENGTCPAGTTTSTVAANGTGNVQLIGRLSTDAADATMITDQDEIDDILQNNFDMRMPN